MKRVIFALTSHDRKGHTGLPTGFYLPEAAHPWAILREAGYVIDFVSPQGGCAPMDGLANPDPVSRAMLDDPQAMAGVQNTARPEQVEAADYAGIFYVGGHGAMWDFPDDQGLAKLGGAIYEAGGVVAAVCHGPSALVNLRLSDGSYLVEGKRIAAFTDAEEQAVNLADVVPFLLASVLQKRGAIHVPAPDWQANTVVDGCLVTGQNPASAEGVGREMLCLLNGLSG